MLPEFLSEKLQSIAGLSQANADLATSAILAILATVILVTFVAASAVFFIWLERKVAGRIQDRLGPTRVGGRFGWLQTIADGMKLLVKEDIIPANADHMLFRMGPYIAFCGAFLAFLALPFGKNIVARNLNVAVFFMLAVMSTEVFGIILAGYGSGSKWSLFGGMREAAQMVSYEVPMAICVLIPVVVVGSMNLNQVGIAQAGFFWQWLVFHDPFTFCAFWVYFCCAVSQCKRAPFDLAEAESELVAGFHTEYSGLRWSFFFMGEYGAMFAVSGIATILFLGGWNLGVLPPGKDMTDYLGVIVGSLVNVTVFVLKGWTLVFVMMWVRWTLPRLRIDQVMMTCLKYFLPVSCALLAGVAIWEIFHPSYCFDMAARMQPEIKTGWDTGYYFPASVEWIGYAFLLTMGYLHLAAPYVLGFGSLILFVLAALRISVSNTPPMPMVTGLWDNPSPAVLEAPKT